MLKGLALVFFIFLACNTSADSFRCKGGVVKNGDSVNALIKKCGDPQRKYNTYESINDHGRRYDVGVTNWVYARTGQKDMIVSVRNGVVLKADPD